MRAGEVLETVPGVIISQHSGEGKANQYYLRGFNLDHGTDFATTVAGMPVNMPTHGARARLFRPELPDPRAGQRRAVPKGPYFADQGDFATAGAANINYANALDEPIVRRGRRRLRLRTRACRGVAAGRRAATCWPRSRSSTTTVRGRARTTTASVNGVAPLQRGRHRQRLSLTGMGYRGDWNSTDQVPQRADRRRADRPLRRARSDRRRRDVPLQRLARVAAAAAATRRRECPAYGIGYDLNLFSNFTFFLDDPDRRRPVRAGRSPVRHRREASATAGSSAGRARSVQNTVGVQLRNDDIATSACTTRRRGSALSTRARRTRSCRRARGVYAQNEIAVDAVAAHAGRAPRATAIAFDVDCRAIR